MDELKKDFTLIRYTDLYYFGGFLLLAGFTILILNIGNSIYPYIGVILICAGWRMFSYYKNKIAIHKLDKSVKVNSETHI